MAEIISGYQLRDKSSGKDADWKHYKCRRWQIMALGTVSFTFLLGKLYKGRTVVERVNARLKLFWGADDGNITGARRFHAFVGMVMVAHAAFATLLAAASLHGTKTVGKLGSLHLGKVQEALHEGIHSKVVDGRKEAA